MYFEVQEKHFCFFLHSIPYFFRQRVVPLQSCLNNYLIMGQFKFDIQLIFAILNGKVSTAINRKLHRNFRQEGIDISPEQWTEINKHIK